MKLNLTFFQGAAPVNLPAIPPEIIKSAGEAEWRLLYAVAAGLVPADADPVALGATLGVTAEAILSAVGFWQERGLLTVPDQPSAAPGAAPASGGAKKPTPKKTKVHEIPIYTDAEFTELLQERQGELGDLITEAQNAFGKVFNLAETKIFVSLLDTFGFESEIMLMILAFCNRIDKRNMRYAEQLTASLYDQQIESPEELTEYLHVREEAHTLEGHVRSTFGIGSRALTTKEKAILTAWNESNHYPWSLIHKAYEVNVAAIGKPSLSYVNSILERWQSEGITTAEAVDAVPNGTAGAKGTAKNGNISFDVDQFFRAAVERSYSDAPTEKKE